MLVALVNDTSTQHTGCKLVVKTIIEELERRDAYISVSVPVNQPWDAYRGQLDKADLVIVNGEGSIHDGKNPRLLAIAEHYPSVLVNAVYQNMKPNPWLEKFLLVSVRESFSAAEMESQGANPLITPDLMFMQNLYKPKGEGMLVIDSVETGTLTSKQKHRYGFVNMQARSFLDIARTKETMCTGRFHGACLAMMWDMPFAAYPSNTWKIPGMLYDAGCSDLYYESMQQALRGIKYRDCSEYVSNARKSITDLFDKICDLS